MPLSENGPNQFALEITPPYRRSPGASVLQIGIRELRVAPVNRTPSTMHADRVEYTGRQWDFLPLSLTIIRPTLTSQRPLLENVRRKKIAEVIRSWDTYGLGVIEMCVLGFLLAAPFFLLLRLRRYSEIADDPELRVIIPLASLYVLLYVGIGIIRAAGNLLYALKPLYADRIIENCGNWIGSSFGGEGALTVVFVSFLWPHFLAHWQRHAIAGMETPLIPTGRRWPAYISLILTVIGWLVVVYLGSSYCRMDRQAFLGDQEFFLTVFAIALVTSLLAGFLYLATELSRGWISLGLAAISAIVAIVYIAADQFGSNSVPVRMVTLTIISIPPALAVLRTLRGVFYREKPEPIGANWSLFARIAAAAGFAIFVYLLVRPLNPLDTTPAWWVVSNGLVQLALAIRLAMVAFLIVILKRLSVRGSWAVLEPVEREAGVVLMLAFFFLPSHNWLYISVVFGLGYLLLRHWIFVERNIRETPGGNVPETVRDLIRLNEGERALRLMKKELTSEVAKGTKTFDDYTSSVSDLETKLSGLRRRVRSRDAGQAAILSSGTKMEPWTRAILGARYATLFAIPWIAFYIYKMHLADAPNRGYEWISVVASAAQAIGQWTLIGFLIGYFYAHLRGEDGLGKGFCFFLTLVTPSFAATAMAMATNPLEWNGFAIWALQLFVVCILTGLLAGDFETLRSSGLGWRQLTDIHNLGSLTAWGSSLIIAIGAGVITAATSNVPTMLKWLFNLK